MGWRANGSQPKILMIVVVALAATLLLVACERPLQDVVDEAYPPPVGIPEEEAEDEGEEASPPAAEEPTTAAPTAETPTEEPMEEPTEAPDVGEDESPRTDEEPAATPEPTDETDEVDEGEGDADEATPEPTAEATPEDDENGEEAGEERVHVVQAGENLYRIGLQYGISWTVLAEYNNLANANDIDVGQQIRIPPVEGADSGPVPTPAPQVTHVVQQGETLFIISQQYGVLWPDIAAANNLAFPYTIYAGQSLVIPGE